MKKFEVQGKLKVTIHKCCIGWFVQEPNGFDLIESLNEGETIALTFSKADNKLGYVVRINGDHIGLDIIDNVEFDDSTKELINTNIKKIIEAEDVFNIRVACGNLEHEYEIVTINSKLAQEIATKRFIDKNLKITRSDEKYTIDGREYEII